MDTKEIYIDVLGYEGLYKASNLGNIFSVVKNKVLRPHINHRGYSNVGFCKNGIQKHFKVHRIILSSFTGIMKNIDVNHKNGNKVDNRLENLEWCTRSENMIHAYNVLGRYCALRDLSVKSRIVINQFTMDGEFIKEHISIRQAMRDTGVNSSSIIKCCKGYEKSAGLFIWNYK